jgi:fructose/tagatose bisphosphate aldolase
MPLLKTSQCLGTLPPDAAIGCFSACNLEGLKAIVSAAEAEGQPVIVSLEENSDVRLDFGPLAAAALHMAQNAAVPVSVHLNHGHGLDMLRDALDLGLPSVMFDGSNLSFEENLRLTSEACLLAHAVGAEIEGEFGPVCIHQGDLERLVTFARNTGLDFLAFSIPRELTPDGAQHGLECLAQVAENTGIPLVLHGASRLSASVLRQALHAGVRKVNVHTDLLRALAWGLRHGMEQDRGKDRPLAWLSVATSAMHDVVRQCIRRFSGEAQSDSRQSQTRSGLLVKPT